MILSHTHKNKRGKKYEHEDYISNSWYNSSRNSCFIFLNKDDSLPNSNNEVAVVSEITPTNPELELEVVPEIVEEIEEIEPEIIEEIEEIEEIVEPEPEISVEASTISIEEPTPVVETPVVETPVVETPVVETPVASTDNSSSSSSSSSGTNGSSYNMEGLGGSSGAGLTITEGVSDEAAANAWTAYNDPNAPKPTYGYNN